jgi:2-polyprenyl-6-methoxyphenol hydroxylase-like FAD-dependent oxidoreductase
MQPPHDCDVFIIGSGLAGLCLARQLLLARPDLSIVMIDRRGDVPRREQKVGEATVQVSGYYLSRVLGLEEHLLRHHYVKYNLRFYWPTATGGHRYEDLSQSFIRGMSNIFTYQLDRNVLEAELLRVNREHPSFRFHAPAKDLAVDLGKGGALHGFRFQTADGEVGGQTPWVIDAAGRSRFLAKKLGLLRESPIRHDTTFFWVDGLLDIEKLTDLSPREIRLRPDRSALGHVPALLATNHFCGEGYWFWVIPLHGRTSLGLVFDPTKVPREEVRTPAQCIDWVCKQHPLFARDLPHRQLVGRGGFVNFAHDCSETLSADGWAMVGEAGRFTDPLYSPGGDLISIYCTVVADAILTGSGATSDRQQLIDKVRWYQALEWAVYEAYVPSYAVSYETLGDQECFSLRYVWELAIYFSFYVFPFINDLFTTPGFLPIYLRRFGRLGPINHGIHGLLRDYYRWKKEHRPGLPAEPVFFEFYEAWALKMAETCFYQVGVSPERAREILDEQVTNLEEMARWIAAHVAANVLDDPRTLHHPSFVGGIDPAALAFEPEAWRERLAKCGETSEAWRWSFEPMAHTRFRGRATAADGEGGDLSTAGGLTAALRSR